MAAQENSTGLHAVKGDGFSDASAQGQVQSTRLTLGVERDTHRFCREFAGGDFV